MVAEERDEPETLSGRLERDEMAGVLPVTTPWQQLGEFLPRQRERFDSADWSAPRWPDESSKRSLRTWTARSTGRGDQRSLPRGWSV